MTTASLTVNANQNIDLVIQPAKSDKNFTEEDIYELIAASKYNRLFIEKSNIKNAIVELNEQLLSLTSGIQGKSITYQVLTRIHASITFKIDTDEMSATAEVTPALGGNHITAPNIVDEAKKIGINKGFIKDAIIILAKTAKLYALDERYFGQKAKKIIATGKLPKNGRDTKIEPLVESAQARILKPKENEDGTVDMRDLGDIICVKKGDSLMQRIPFTNGVPGYTVTGTILPPTPGEDISLSIGKGTELSPNNENLLISKLIGLPKIINNGMEVDQVYNVNNVDVGSGHIKFEGSVIISGDVKDNMEVIASGDITVAGFVESAYLESGGDITIQKGIIGRKQEVDDDADINTIEMSAVIKAKGSIYAMYSQYANINCQGSLRIENQLMHNIATVGDNLWIGSEKKADGKLIGGYTHAVKSIQAGIIGATAGSKTTMVFTKRISEYKEGITEANEELLTEELKAKELESLITKLNALSTPNEETLKKVTSTHEHHIRNIEILHFEKNRAEQQLQDYINSISIKAADKMYHGVEIQIDNLNEKVHRERGPSRVFYQERKIHVEPLIHS